MILLLINLLLGVVGLILILRHLILGVVQRNSLQFKKSGKVFLVIVGFFAISTTIEFFLKQFKNRGLVMYAWREAPIGGIWLKLFENNKFQLGYLPNDKELEENYIIKGNTLFLEGEKVSSLLYEGHKISFLIKEKQLLEIKGSNIAALEISMNEVKRK